MLLLLRTIFNYNQLLFFYLFWLLHRQLGGLAFISLAIRKLIKLVDSLTLGIDDLFEEFGDFELFVVFKEMGVFGFEVKVDAGVGGE